MFSKKAILSGLVLTVSLFGGVSAANAWFAVSSINSDGGARELVTVTYASDSGAIPTEGAVSLDIDLSKVNVDNIENGRLFVTNDLLEVDEDNNEIIFLGKDSGDTQETAFSFTLSPKDPSDTSEHTIRIKEASIDGESLTIDENSPDSSTLVVFNDGDEATSTSSKDTRNSGSNPNANGTTSDEELDSMLDKETSDENISTGSTGDTVNLDKTEDKTETATESDDTKNSKTAVKGETETKTGAESVYFLFLAMFLGATWVFLRRKA